MFQDSSTGWVTTTVPASAPLEKEGTITNLEGRVQRLRARRPPRASSTGSSGWRSWRTGWARGARVAARRRDPGAAPSSQPNGPPARPRRHRCHRRRPQGRPDGIVVVGYRQLMSGAEVDHAEQLDFQRRRSIELPTTTPSRWASPPATAYRELEGRLGDRPGAVNRRLRTGVVRLATAVPHVGPGTSPPPSEAPADA